MIADLVVVDLDREMISMSHIVGWLDNITCSFLDLYCSQHWFVNMKIYRFNYSFTDPFAITLQVGAKFESAARFITNGRIFTYPVLAFETFRIKWKYPYVKIKQSFNSNINRSCDVRERSLYLSLQMMPILFQI